MCHVPIIENTPTNQRSLVLLPAYAYLWSPYATVVTVGERQYTPLPRSSFIEVFSYSFEDGIASWPLFQPVSYLGFCVARASIICIFNTFDREALLLIRPFPPGPGSDNPTSPDFQSIIGL